jgi:hypothetical protein
MVAAWSVPNVCHVSVAFVADLGNSGLAGGNVVIRALPVRSIVGACRLIVIMRLSHNWQEPDLVQDVLYVRSDRRDAITWFVPVDLNGAMSVSVTGIDFIINAWIETEIDLLGCVLYLEMGLILWNQTRC